jgi:methyl-accepting chemotaxis protein
MTWRRFVTIRRKILWALSAGALVALITGIGVMQAVLRESAIKTTQATMRATLLEAESMRELMSGLAVHQAFDQTRLKEQAGKSSDFRSSTLYATVPVVAAWRGAEHAAKVQGFEFRVVREQARNPKNAPNAVERKILAALSDRSVDEYFEVNKEKNEVYLARPVVMTQDCMACHGDPATSPTGDGKDALGFRMEGWKAGQRQGMFLLRANLGKVEEQAKAALWWWIGFVILPIGVVVLFAIVMLTRKWIDGPLKKVIDDVDAVVREAAEAAVKISAAGGELARNAANQASVTENASDELERTIQQSRQRMRVADDATQLAMEAAEAGEQGKKELDHMVTAMRAIRESSSEIARIIRDVDAISFQTNILALNAAVEAARAGEFGAGFAVVADEVRNLALRSADAAKKTEDQIREAIERSDSGVAMCTRMGERVDVIVGKGKQVHEVVEQLVQVCRGQMSDMEGATRSMGELNRMTTSIASASDATERSSKELAEQNTRLKQAVRRLAELVGRD